MSLKGETVEKLQKRAKKENKKLSPLLDELLEGEAITKSDLEEMRKRIVKDIGELIREEVTAILEEARRSW